MNEAPQRSSSSPTPSPSSRLERLEQLWHQDPLTRLFPALAEEYRAAGRFAEGAQVCREGLEVYPGFAAARVTLGRILLELGAEAEAERELDTALRQSPDNLLGLRLLARLLGDRGEGERARPLLRRLLELSPGDEEALRLEQALAPAEKAAAAAAPDGSAGEAPAGLQPEGPEPAAGDRRAGPEAAEPHAEYLTPTMAELYLEQGLPERALAVYRRLLDVDPENREIAERLALLASRLERGEAAGPPPPEAAAGEGEAGADLPRRKAQALGSWLEAARLGEKAEPSAVPPAAIRGPAEPLPAPAAPADERERRKVDALGRWLAAARRLN